ncbi:MAG: ModD protein [Candidatus Competibacter sp.]|nr:ModD protein [Candidatus Competibacter sp.]
MMPLISDAEIDRWLAEDVPFGDLTTHALGIGERPGHMVFAARDAMVVAASEEAARLLVRAGCAANVQGPSGCAVEAGTPLLVAEGPAAALLTGWKVAQTLMEYASGIATVARRIVEAARAVNPGVVVACTRKTFPGAKAISIKAILAGGAIPHRLGLSETVLVFPEHRAFLAEEDPASALARLTLACPERKIVVEVNDLDEAVLAAQSGADVVQLEKLPPEMVAAVVARLADMASSVKVAAAGGVKSANAADYARAGVHILVTSAPYFAPPVDIKVSISAC